MQVDEARWRALVDALANANDTSPAFRLLQQAHGRWSRARSDLETFQKRGASGVATERNPDVTASFQREVAELEARVGAADREVKRIEALHRETSAQRGALQALVDGCRAWAAAQSPPVRLPDDSDDVRQLAGFASSSVHVSTPPAHARRAFP